jgi:indole-3-glycerol phosphate synthase
MTNFLQQAITERRKDARAAQKKLPWDELRRQASAARTRRSLRETWQRLRAEGQRPCIIAEVKKASPSAGCLRPDYRPAAVAADYEQAGAAAISVLTEPRHFQGSDNDLRAVRQAVKLPILRKDFISEPYQVAEAAALGADLVLLIAAALAPPRLRALYDLTLELGLEALVEVHSREELEYVAPLEQALIGVNSRDLVSLKTDLATTRGLAPFLPKGRLCVAESGIRARADIEELQSLGYGAFLIGESLLSAPDAGAALRALLEPAGAERAGSLS